MNAKEISAKRFDKSAFGYKADEVDAYLNEVAAAVNELTTQNAELQNKLEILATKLEEYRQDENSMKEALIGAQKLGNNILKEARDKAEELVAEAQTKGDAIIREATESSQKTLASVKKEIEKEQHALLMTQREVSGFKSKLLALYKSHLDTITTIPELKEEENPAEELTSKLADNAEDTAEQPETAPAETLPETAAEENKTEKNAAENTSESTDEAPPLFASRFGTPSEEIRRRNTESKFGDLRFGRNAKK